MTQKLTWLTKASAIVSDSIACAGKITILVTKSAGPLSFSLYDESSEETHKVSIGALHHCDCTAFKKYQESCVHICWLLTKKFKVDPQDEMMFQKGLNENYLASLFNMEKYHETKQAEKRKQHDVKKAKTKRRVLTRDDECPICFDKFFQSVKGITQCNTCNNHVHIPCRMLWKRNGDCDTKDRCPYCRGDFGQGISIHPSLIPWRKEPSKKPTTEPTPTVTVHEIIIPNFTTECIMGQGLTEKKETLAAPPVTRSFSDWTSGLPSAFASTTFISTDVSDQPTNELTIAGRGLPQFNSSQIQTGPVKEPTCDRRSVRQRWSAPNVLSKAISAIRHNQQVSTKGPTAMLELTKIGESENVNSYGDRKMPDGGTWKPKQHPMQKVLKQTGVTLRTSLSESTSRLPNNHGIL